jgi:hypothetical protein
MICLAVTPCAWSQTAPMQGSSGTSTGGSTQIYPGMPMSPYDHAPMLRVRPRPPLPPIPPVIVNNRPQVYLNNANIYDNAAGASESGYGKNEQGVQNRYTPAEPSTPKPLAAPAYPSHEPLLEGLAKLKPAETYIYRGDVVNVRGWMRPKELATLVSSVNGDQRVYANAERLTERLQSGGLLRPGDRVVGFHEGKVFVVVGRH